ncbi:MAG TPA: flavin reductase family protein [candidate division Zixibacteria bacterium]|nr:flavin reductase family protein [candidate division Zixibacteria bacterium]
MSQKEKVEVRANLAYKLLHPMHTVLVTSVGKTGKPNIITLAWAMPTSINPPLVAISVSPRRYSHTLIEETKEFVVNIPTLDILDKTVLCGTTSGRNHDKFKETGLTPLPGKKVKAPLIDECVGHLECKLYSQFKAGDHTIFVGEIVDAHADKRTFTDTYDLKRTRMIFHLGGDKYSTLESKIFGPKALSAISSRSRPVKG